MPVDNGRPEWVAVKNDHAEPCPAFGVMQVTGIDTTDTGTAVTVTQPQESLTGRILVNDAAVIPESGDLIPYGQGTFHTRVIAAYDQADGDPDVGDEWGPGQGSWLLKAAGRGFTCLGGAVNGVANWSRQGRVTVTFAAELTSAWQSTGYSWKRLRLDTARYPPVYVDADPAVTGDTAAEVGGNVTLQSGTRVVLHPSPDDRFPDPDGFMFSYCCTQLSGSKAGSRAGSRSGSLLTGSGYPPVSPPPPPVNNDCCKPTPGRLYVTLVGVSGSCLCLDGVTFAIDHDAASGCWLADYSPACGSEGIYSGPGVPVPTWFPKFSLCCSGGGLWSAASLKAPKHTPPSAHGCGYGTDLQSANSCIPFYLEFDGVVVSDPAPVFDPNCCSGVIDVVISETPP